MFVVRKCFDLIMLISKRVSFSLGMIYPLKHPFEFVSWELQRVWFPLLCTHLAIPMNIFHCITFHNWSIAWWRCGRLLNMVATKIIKFCLYFWTLCLIHKRELSLKSSMLASYEFLIIACWLFQYDEISNLLRALEGGIFLHSYWMSFVFKGKSTLKYCRAKPKPCV